jgi:hypothetical protein
MSSPSTFFYPGCRKKTKHLHIEDAATTSGGQPPSAQVRVDFRNFFFQEPERQNDIRHAASRPTSRSIASPELSWNSTESPKPV